MALLHDATITPTKLEAIVAWLPSRPWAAGLDHEAVEAAEVVGAFRFDDPEGRVGIETHLVRCGETVLQVPLTYRGAPLDDAEDALVCTMEHSALGRRWIYDGCADPVATTMLAAATLTGVGQAGQIVEVDGRTLTREPRTRLGGGGWRTGWLPVGGLVVATTDEEQTVLRSEALELRVVHRLSAAAPPADVSHLTATWEGHDEPVVLATAELR